MTSAGPDQTDRGVVATPDGGSGSRRGPAVVLAGVGAVALLCAIIGMFYAVNFARCINAHPGVNISDTRGPCVALRATLNTFTIVGLFGGGLAVIVGSVLIALAKKKAWDRKTMVLAWLLCLAAVLLSIAAAVLAETPKMLA